MPRALLACAVALVLTACADQTGILVNVTSPDIVVPNDVDALHMRAYTPDGLMFDQTFPVRSTWPHSLLIRPAAGEALGQVQVEVTGMKGTDFVVRRSVLTAFMAGQVRRVDVELRRDCFHVMCAMGTDCVAGACQGPGIDGGVSDAGPGDAGSDAGSDAGDDAGDDAAPFDGGHDGGSDAGSDAGHDAALPCAGAGCVGHVVISEMSAYMSNEFIELYNRGGTNADIGGCAIEYAMAGSWAARGTIPAGAVLPAHHYYLVANAGYTGSPAPDAPGSWSTGFLDSDGAVRIQCSGTALDTFGWGTALQHEGTAATRLDASLIASGSYERKASATSTTASMGPGGSDVTAGNGYDTDDNAADFVPRATRDPQSSASPAEP
jgi:hypothetical protein